MGEYMPSSEEEKAYVWCIRNNIKISPTANSEGSWWIEININGNINRSPEPFKKVRVWEKLYEYCKYYYDKHKK